MFYLFKNTSGEIHNRCCGGVKKKNVTELEDSNRNYPEQRNPREKRKRPSQGPRYTLRDDGLCEEGLGPDESGGLPAPQLLLSPHGHLGSRRDPGPPWLPAL